MKVVIDTNVFVSALLVRESRPAMLIKLWREGRFDLLTAETQITELNRVTRYPKIRERLNPALAGRLINEIRDVAAVIRNLPAVDASPDPYDNYLLSIAAGGDADYLITGDKDDLLALTRHNRTSIIGITDFLRIVDRYRP